jgi:hypothetical protein
MADAEEASVNVFLVAGVIALLAFVGLGLWFFFAPGKELDRAAGAFPERTEVADIQDEEARDSLARKLVLTRYDLQQDPAVVSGSVLNNTGQPFVNVQVGFRLLDADGDSVSTVRDTTSIVEADDSWVFRISLPPGRRVTRVEATDLQGTPKAPLGPDARSVRRPEEGAPPDSARP